MLISSITERSHRPDRSHISEDLVQAASLCLCHYFLCVSFLKRHPPLLFNNSSQEEEWLYISMFHKTMAMKGCIWRGDLLHMAPGLSTHTKALDDLMPHSKEDIIVILLVSKLKRTALDASFLEVANSLASKVIKFSSNRSNLRAEKVELA